MLTEHMPTTQKNRSLEVHQQLTFARREWKIQRFAWACMAAVLAAALAGLFGNGPLSRATASAGDLHIEYDRFVHADAPTELKVSVVNLSGDTALLEIDRSLVEALDMRRMQPRATRALSTAHSVIFEFALSDAHELHVLIEADPQSAGVVSGALRIRSPAGEPAIRVKQWVYP